LVDDDAWNGGAAVQVRELRKVVDEGASGIDAVAEDRTRRLGTLLLLDWLSADVLTDENDAVAVVHQNSRNKV
jgi:hypothetical protein